MSTFNRLDPLCLAATICTGIWINAYEHKRRIQGLRMSSAPILIRQPYSKAKIGLIFTVVVALLL